MIVYCKRVLCSRIYLVESSCGGALRCGAVLCVCIVCALVLLESWVEGTARQTGQGWKGNRWIKLDWMERMDVQHTSCTFIFLAGVSAESRAGRAPIMFFFLISNLSPSLYTLLCCIMIWSVLCCTNTCMFIYSVHQPFLFYRSSLLPAVRGWDDWRILLTPFPPQPVKQTKKK